MGTMRIGSAVVHLDDKASTFYVFDFHNKAIVPVEALGLWIENIDPLFFVCRCPLHPELVQWKVYSVACGLSIAAEHTVAYTMRKALIVAVAIVKAKLENVEYCIRYTAPDFNAALSVTDYFTVQKKLDETKRYKASLMDTAKV